MKIHYYLRLIVLIVVITSCGGDRSTESIEIQPVPPDTSAKAYEQNVQLYDALFLENFRKNANQNTINFTSVEGFESLEIVSRKGSVDPSEDLREDGFTEACDELILVSMSPDQSSNKLVHLYISKAGIHDSEGNTLIDQIDATHGYGWRIGKTTGSDTVPARSYLVIIMLDENGKANSDELFIYRSYESGKLGNFVVTNLPDELL